jgi:hypothetical protein
MDSWRSVGQSVVSDPTTICFEGQKSGTDLFFLSIHCSLCLGRSAACAFLGSSAEHFFYLVNKPSCSGKLASLNAIVVSIESDPIDLTDRSLLPETTWRSVQVFVFCSDAISEVK